MDHGGQSWWTEWERCEMNMIGMHIVWASVGLS